MKILDDMDDNIAILFSNNRRIDSITNYGAGNIKLFFQEHLAVEGVSNYIVTRELKEHICILNPR